MARGSFANDPDRHFYLCEFAHMLNHEIPPPPYDWASAAAQLHLQSMGKSPVPNHFGFGVPTFLADVPVDNTWNASWEAFWAQQMRGLFEREERLNGPDEELTRLRKAYFEKAIPRYLGPLERNGRSVVPCLLHSDLCLGNVRLLTAASGGDLCIFDACAYWGHNEGVLLLSQEFLKPALC
ncbi:hypothetical protein B0T26DRAFT_725183 [Lasiosphaeria miniovina]|uniref:protein-ribulosamine 3-kinase n=1 Tax=Lasiosphaeria miniovina TaxID=1954250 RepID=A0AA39ZYY1_9PEZI|nr:uncharacterized protein B0T26DRAFT_725183 [Lasiosphaeria miniovina]KAK0705999.1 hypothetical protein B0T26DRAFT_725183 [Lasiosphaeria miniovina]